LDHLLGKTIGPLIIELSNPNIGLSILRKQ
jgi:hypothetical protein